MDHPILPSRKEPSLRIIMVTYLLGGLLLVGLALPLIRRRIKPNPWYGFRVAKTLADSKLWYDVNAYSGRLLLYAGIATCLAAVALWFIPGLGLGSYALGCATVALGSLLLTLLLSFRYLNSLS